MPNNILQLASSVAKPSYEDDFYAHLNMLSTVEFAFNHDVPFKYDQRKYISLEQATFEDAPEIEHAQPAEVDWGAIDNNVYEFQDRLQRSLNGQADGRQNMQVLDFSTKCYEQWITYKEMYPESKSNPWLPTVKMIRRGYLLYVSDNIDELRGYSRLISKSVKDENQGNIGVVVKGASSFGGFVIDNRYEIQKIVHAFLRREGDGHERPISLKNIQSYLLQRGIKMPIDMIQINITTPLKKTGFVGSTGRGFFIINTVDDLVSSYCFHLTKVMSGNTILRQYQARSLAFDGINLEAECGGANLNEVE